MAVQPRKPDANRSGIVEYGLVRHGLVESLRKGKVRREDVCDAPTTREVTSVFGAKLPPGGTCPSSKAELARLERREEPVVCYAVEACTGCGFHHLARKWQAGGRPARRPAKRRAQ